MAKVFWFTGISGAGKSTLASMLHDYLLQNERPSALLDGNDIRDFFDNDLGFTEEDRHSAIKRTVFGSYLLKENGVHAVVASIAAKRENREFAKAKLKDDYIEIWIDTPVSVAAERDPRGLYGKLKEGTEKNLPGIDQQYDPPSDPSVHIMTEGKSVEESFSELLAVLESSHLDHQS